ncbi:MAG: hypothetical protein JWM56_316 [Candidatus Peribacteria bacterium]|nr:hypothetical protein [Candidatus Peribacteria bacterium]
MRFPHIRIGVSALVAAGLLFCGAEFAFASISYESTVATTGLVALQGLWVSASGSMYMVNAGTTSNSRILHYSVTGALIRSRTITGAVPRTIVVDPTTGYVYVTGSGKLLQYTDFDNSSTYNVLISSGLSVSTLAPAQGMIFNADRTKLYVGTSSSNVKVYNTSDWSLSQVFTPPTASNTTDAGPLALDSHGNLYMVDYRGTSGGSPVGNARVIRFASGSTTGTVYKSGYVDTLNANAVDSPSGVFIDSSDNLYVLLRGSKAGGDGAIYKYNASGTLLTSLRTTGTAILNLPIAGIWVDANGYIYAVSSNGGLIKRFTQTIDPPTAVTATEGATSISLSWTNATNAQFDSVSIRRSTSSYPATVTDGTAVTSGLTGTSFTDTGLTGGRYYYSLFTKDISGNYSEAANVSGVIHNACFLKAYWQMDATPETPVDATGNGYTGSVAGTGSTPSLSTDVPTTGLVNPYSFLFDGNDYFSVSRPIQDDYSICAWIKTTTFGNGSGDQHWFSMSIAQAEIGGSVANDFGFGVDINGDLVSGNGNGTTDYAVRGATAVNTGNWTHVCTTRKKSDGAIKLYVNGILDGSGVGGTTSLTSQATMMIGYGQDDSRYWNGNMDGLRMYDYVLTADEVSSLATGVNACYSETVLPSSSSSSSSSSSEQPQQSHGGSRGSGTSGTAHPLSTPSIKPSAASPVKPGTPPPVKNVTTNQPPASSSVPTPIQTKVPEMKVPQQVIQRVCNRVAKQFLGNGKMISRLNSRVERQFGSGCGG